MESPSKNTTPTFSGTASEKAPVKVVVYEGPTPEGKIAATVETEVTGSSCSLKVPCKWSVAVTKALFEGVATHVYTAVAEQTSKLTSLEGVSEPQTFEIDTRPPRVTITQIGPQVGEHEAQPTLTGTATDPKEEVTVRLYQGGEAKGVEVATLKAAVTGGRWAVQVPSALQEGKYTALATQPSSLKNPTGESPPMTFEVITKPPVVTLREIPSPTSDAAPSFSGTATDPKEKVVVRVYAGSQAEGTPVASIEAEPDNGQWSSATLADRRRVAAGRRIHGDRRTEELPEEQARHEPADPASRSRFSRPRFPKSSASANRTAAIMNATVNANGGRLSACHFEYGTTTGYGKEARMRATSSAAPGPEDAGCAFTVPRRRSRTANSRSTARCPCSPRASRLTPGTTYFFRIVTENEHGNGNQGVGEGSFRTAPPEVVEETPLQTTEHEPHADQQRPERRRAGRHDRQGAGSERKERLDLEAPEERRLPARVQAPGGRHRDDRLVLPAARARA